MEWDIALGALALVLSISLGALLSRWYVAPVGAHRAPRVLEETVPLAELLGPARPYGAAVTQAFRYCPPCGGTVPVVLHPGAHRCDRGHLTIPATEGTAS